MSQVDYVVLARYMQVLPPASVGSTRGEDHQSAPRSAARLSGDSALSRCLSVPNAGLAYHFIVPELDAGNQIIEQTSFSVPPGTSLESIRLGQEDERGVLWKEFGGLQRKK